MISGVAALIIAAIVGVRIVYRRRRPPMESPAKDAAPPGAPQTVAAPPAEATRPAATPLPRLEDQPAPSAPPLTRIRNISAFRPVMQPSADRAHPPAEATYVWE
jgi:hypothetical protein